MSGERRDIYAAEGLRYMPQILTMLDQNPFSTTYGCGDRPFWLYKSKDFPSGMYGVFALPLALACTHEFPGNVYFGQPRIKELALAVIRHQARAAHADGSGDDFFPFERAMGSTAFTLYAMAEAVHHLGIGDEDVLAFLARRARWLAGCKESGRLTNHHALGALGLAAVHRLTGERTLKKESIKIRDRVLRWQSEEGWFPEYDGFDPGYDTFTISFLAHLRRMTGDDTLTRPLARAINLTARLVGPDGSHGGETGWRNSYHFLPHGFELLAKELGQARYVADRFLDAVKNGYRSYLDENWIFCHYQYNYLQSWLDYAERDGCPDWSPGKEIHHYTDAGLLCVRRDTVHAVVSLRKGGIIKASTKAGPLASDTGPVILDRGGKIYAPSRDGLQTSEIVEEESGNAVITVATYFERIPNTILPTPWRFILFRLINLTAGRLAPNLLRRLIQYLLINRRNAFPARLTRRIRIGGDGVFVRDSLERLSDNFRISRLASSTDLTTIFSASSNAWHASRFFSWTDLDSRVGEFNETGALEIDRAWRVDGK